MDKLARLDNAFTKAVEIINERLWSKKYFTSVHYLNNMGTFQKLLVSKNDLDINSLATYLVSANILLVQEEYIDLLPDDVLVILTIHELLHFFSANRAKNITGYKTDEFWPSSYNEGCTQWLALRLFYGDEYKEGLKSNFVYPKSVDSIDKLVDIFGEDVIFQGYFYNDLKMSSDLMDKSKKHIWVDIFINMGFSAEEHTFEDNIKHWQSLIDEYKRQ